MPVFDFPNWEVSIDGHKISHNKENLLKRIQFNLKPGNYQVAGKLKDTPVRMFSNLISLLSLSTLLFILKYGRKFQKN